MRTHHQGTPGWQQNPILDAAETARLFELIGHAVTSLETGERALHMPGNAIDPAAEEEQTAEDAFDFAAAASERLLRRAIEAEDSGPGKLDAFVTAFRSAIEHPPGERGLPAVYADMPSFEALPFLQPRVRAVVDGWRHHVRRIVRFGIRQGEFRPSARPEQVSSVVVGTMEGALFLHRLYGDARHLDHSVAHLQRYFEIEVFA